MSTSYPSWKEKEKKGNTSLKYGKIHRIHIIFGRIDAPMQLEWRLIRNDHFLESVQWQSTHLLYGRVHLTPSCGISWFRLLLNGRNIVWSSRHGQWINGIRCQVQVLHTQNNISILSMNSMDGWLRKNHSAILKLELQSPEEKHRLHYWKSQVSPRFLDLAVSFQTSLHITLLYIRNSPPRGVCDSMFKKKPQVTLTNRVSSWWLELFWHSNRSKTFPLYVHQIVENLQTW